MPCFPFVLLTKGSTFLGYLVIFTNFKRESLGNIFTKTQLTFSGISARIVTLPNFTKARSV